MFNFPLHVRPGHQGNFKTASSEEVIVFVQKTFCEINLTLMTVMLTSVWLYFDDILTEIFSTRLFLFIYCECSYHLVLWHHWVDDGNVFFLILFCTVFPYVFSISLFLFAYASILLSVLLWALLPDLKRTNE